jgi:hypothetical protein
VARHRWEYISLRGGPDRQGLFYVVVAINGRTVREQPGFYDYVARLGQEGWELVGSDAGTLWFKRPLEDAAPAVPPVVPPRPGPPDLGGRP